MCEKKKMTEEKNKDGKLEFQQQAQLSAQRENLELDEK